jgi:hypothetical protein
MRNKCKARALLFLDPEAVGRGGQETKLENLSTLERKRTIFVFVLVQSAYSATVKTNG